jgi:hypothetical protein
MNDWIDLLVDLLLVEGGYFLGRKCIADRDFSPFAYSKDE